VSHYRNYQPDQLQSVYDRPRSESVEVSEVKFEESTWANASNAFLRSGSMRMQTKPRNRTVGVLPAEAAELVRLNGGERRAARNN